MELQRPNTAAESFVPPSLEFARRKAKLLRRHLEDSGVPLKLSRVQEGIAAAYGAKDWYTLASLMERGRPQSTLDDELSDAAIETRRRAQATALTARLGLDAKLALAALDAVRISATAHRAAMAHSRKKPALDLRDPGCGELLLTVRRLNTELPETSALNAVMVGFAKSDRFYVRLVDDSFGIEDLSSVITGLRAVLGDKALHLVSPKIDMAKLPILEAANRVGATLETASDGRRGARMAVELDEFFWILNGRCRDHFEAPPTLKELEAISHRTGAAWLVLRSHESKGHPEARQNLYDRYDLARDMASRLCRLRGRDPDQGLQRKEASPFNAPLNTHLGEAPPLSSVDGVRSAMIRDGMEMVPDVQVREYAGLIQDALRKGEAGSAAASELGARLLAETLEILSDSRDHWRSSMIGVLLPSRRLSYALGQKSAGAAMVENAMGAALNSIITTPDHYQARLVTIAVRITGHPDNRPGSIQCLPVHAAIERALSRSLGGTRFVMDPDLQQVENASWTPHLALTARVLRNRHPFVRGMELCTPKTKGTALKQIRFTKEPPAQALVQCVQVYAGTDPMPTWKDRQHLLTALAEASAICNARLEKWGSTVRIEFTDLMAYGDGAKPTSSLLKTLPAGGIQH